MSGQDSGRTTMLGRLAIALLTIAAALALAPVTTASPESDAANEAITAAWDASGGDGGPLGPRQGDVYPIGAGFALNCTGGKIFFSPDTGAHFLQGAILEKYESLGGAADSDLGFPTSDEGPGRAPDSRNATFSASDKPVIFWTPDTGARVVRGPINAAWDKLGGSSGALGVPAEDETYSGDLVSQKFTGGSLTFNTREKNFTTEPPELAGQLEGLSIPDDPTSAINAARRAAGGPLGPLGAAQGPTYQIGKDGVGQNFAGGKIFYSPATGAKVVTGQVLAKYESVGGPEGDLGFPVTDEVDGGLPTTSRMSTFAAEGNPAIFWTPEYGAVVVRGAMKAAWDKLDAAKGALGAPVADQSERGDVVTQRFNGGVVSWDRSSGEFSTEPANLASGLAGLQVPGEQKSEAPAGPQTSHTADRKWFSWSWWWLLAIIPVLVLIGLVAVAAQRNRGRGDNKLVGFDDHRYDDGFGGEADNSYPPEPTSSADDYAAAMFGEGHGREMAPAGSESPAVNPWEPPPGGAGEVDENDDDVDTAPTRVLTDAEREAAAERDAAVANTTGREAFLDREADQDTDPEAEPEVDRVDQDFDQDFDSEDEARADEARADEAPFRAEDEAPFADEREAPPAEEQEASIQEPKALFVPAAVPERDPMTDTGRHARIEIDEPEEARPAFRLLRGTSDEAPEGYPIKADTQSGRYWAPDSPGYDDVEAEIWFVSEEFARTNGFVRGD